MPARVALNMVYAHLMTGLDHKQRKAMDDELYGWGAINDRASARLHAPIDDSGGES